MRTRNPLRKLGYPVPQHKYLVEAGGNNPFHQRYYLTDSQRKSLLTEINSSALVLFEYYLRLACKPANQNADIGDHEAARVLGMSHATIRLLRRKLEKAGWLKIIKTRRNKSTGHTAKLCFLGKEAVNNMSGKPMFALDQ